MYCLFLLSLLIITFCLPAKTFLLLNIISFLLVHHHGSKMLRSESNSSITQSPIGWQISHILSLLHEPTSGMFVCTSECVLCVAVGVSCCVSTHREWRFHKPTPLTDACHSQLKLAFMHVVVFVIHITCCWVTIYGQGTFSLSVHATSNSEHSFQFCLGIKLIADDLKRLHLKAGRRVQEMLSWFYSI